MPCPATLRDPLSQEQPFVHGVAPHGPVCRVMGVLRAQKNSGASLLGGLATCFGRLVTPSPSHSL